MPAVVTCAATYLPPCVAPRRKIVPTVNAASPASVEKMLSHFLEFMDLSSDRKRLDSYFRKRDNTPAAVDGSSAFSPPGAGTASKTSSGLAGKRRNSAAGGAAGGPHPRPSLTEESSHSPQGATREMNILEHGGGGALNTLYRRPSSAAQGEGEVVPRPRENPHASAVVPSRRNQQKRATSSGVSAAGTNASGAAHIGGNGETEVELHLVDVEAQKAIMAEIERRQRDKSNNGGRGSQGEREDQTAVARRASPGSRKNTETTQTMARGGGRGGETAHTVLHSAVKLTEKRINATTPFAGVKRGANSSPADGSCSAGRRTGAIFGASGAASGGVIGTKTAAVAAPVKGYECQQEVLAIDDGERAGSPGSGCNPMDIRDFFPRRG